MSLRDVFQNIVEGYAGAAGADDVVGRIEGEKTRERGWSDMQRQQSIAQAQNASMNIGSILRSGKNPDTGAALTPEEVQSYTKQSKELQAQLSDLWNPRQPVGKMGKNVAGATGTPQPKGKGRKVVEALHLAKKTPDVGKAPSSARMREISDIVAKYQTVPEAPVNPYKQTYSQLIEAGLSPEEAKKAISVKAGLEPKATEPKETSDTRARSDYAEYKKQNPDYKGTFEQWKTEQSTAGRVAATPPKPKTSEQQFVELQTKKIMGQPLTAQEQATMKAIQDWNYVRFTQPGLARMQALMFSRIEPIEDPNNPGEIIWSSAANAMGKKAPSSVSHLMATYYTTGKGGQDLLRFNTATHHLQLMQQLGEALNNGDIPRANKLKNQFASEFGSAAPTNFNGIRDAVAGELSRLYTGVGATQEEIKNIESTVNAAQSPDQINGIIQTDLATMHGKIQASAQQFLMGEQGLPAFPEDVVPRRPAAPGAPGVAGDYIYARDPQGKLHRAKKGTALPQGWKVTNAPAQ